MKRAPSVRGIGAHDTGYFSSHPRRALDEAILFGKAFAGRVADAKAPHELRFEPGLQGGNPPLAVYSSGR